MFFQKNSALISPEQLSIEDRGFLYGDGCFSTMRLRDGELQLWPRHLQRFDHAIQQLQLALSVQRLSQEKQQFLTTLQRQHCSDGIVKMLISRGGGARGYAIPQHAADVYCYFYPQAKPSLAPVILDQVGILPNALGCPMPALRGIKSLNRLEQVLLKQQAQAQGWQEALCLDQQQMLVEAISSNCFVYIQGCWISPTLQHTGIAGTMRAEILSRMQHYQIAHQVRMISHTELQQVEAVFLSNALQPMQAIAQLESRQLNLGLCLDLFATLHLAQLV